MEFRNSRSNLVQMFSQYPAAELPKRINPFPMGTASVPLMLISLVEAIRSLGNRLMCSLTLTAAKAVKNGEIRRLRSKPLPGVNECKCSQPLMS